METGVLIYHTAIDVIVLSCLPDVTLILEKLLTSSPPV